MKVTGLGVMRVLVCGSVFLIAATSIDAQLVKMSVRLQAEAIDVSGVLIWRVYMQVAPSDVVVLESTLNSDLKSQCPTISKAIGNRIVKEVVTMAKEENRPSTANHLTYYLIDADVNGYALPDALKPRGFFGALEARLGQSVNSESPLQFRLTPPVGFTRPARAGETLVDADHDWSLWTIEFDPLVLAVTGYELLLRTKKAELNDENATNVTITKTIEEIAKTFRINSLSEEEKRIPVTLIYAPQDLQKKDGTARPVDETMRVLEESAYKAFLVLRESGIHGCQLRDAATDQAIKNGVEDLFTVYGADLNTNSFLNEQSKEMFGISGLQFIEDVDIKVTPVPDDAGNQSPTKRDEEIEELLNKKYKPRLLAKPGEIITREILEKDMQALYLVRSVSGFPKYSFADGVLTYNVERRREVVNLTVTGGGSYSPEDAFNGSVALAGDNLFRRSESLSLSFKGGGSIQKGEFKFVIPAASPKQRPRIPIVFAGLNIDASYFHDSSQRLGNPPHTELSEKEWTIASKLSFEYDSFTERDYVEQAEGIDEDRKRFHQFISLDLGFDVQNTNLESTGEVPILNTVDGRVAFPSLNLRYLGTYDLRKTGRRGGVGEIDFRFSGTGQRGLTILGADFSYRQFELNAGVQMFFGFATPTDLFLRYERGVGASSNQTPLFRIFRLGGAKNVRGLEEGEIIGNSYAYDRTEFGIGFFPLLRTIKQLLPARTKPQPASRGDGAADDSSSTQTGPGGIDLTNTYLKIYYDRGRVFETKSLGDILNPARGVKGYGIAAELRGIAFIKKKRANLTIGYARSPESLLHRRGVLITSLSLDF